MRVLVTGGTSLLGRTVVEQLTDRGDDVSVFQRRPSGLGVAEHLGDVAEREAAALIQYLVSPEGQQRIEEFRVDGEQLFHPVGEES